MRPLTVPHASDQGGARAPGLARRAVVLDPGDQNVWDRFSVAECRTDHRDVALRDAEKAIALNGGGDVYRWLIRALAYAGRGELKEARGWSAKLPPKFEPGETADTPRDLDDEAASLLGTTREAKPVPE